jgi:hypothetical protein
MSRRVVGFVIDEEMLMNRCVALSSLVLLLSATTAYADVRPGKPIRLLWDAPREAVVGYTIHVGTSSGVYTERFDVRSKAAFTYESSVAGQRYFFAVSAYAADVVNGPLSPEVSAVADAAPASPAPRPAPEPVPAPDSDGEGVVRPVRQMPAAGDVAGIVLQAVTVKNQVATLKWELVGDGSVSEYLVEVGTSADASDLANFSVGRAKAASLELQRGVVHHVRVRGRTSTTASLVSNDVAFSSDSPKCTKAPATPTRLEASVTANRMTLSWGSASGAASYVVQLGSEKGMSNLFHNNVGAATTVTSRAGGQSSAYARVIAVNPCGSSAASEEVRVR